MTHGALSTLKRAAIPLLLAWGLAASAGAAHAIDYLNVTVQQDRAVPGACVSFSTVLPRKEGTAFEPFVALDPPADHTLQARGKDLCLTGLKHGKHYVIRLKAGLQAADGTALAKDVAVPVDVPDREATVSFDGNKTLLPYAEDVGVPLKSTNVSKAHITVYRLGERGLADQVGNDWFGQAITGWSLSQLTDRASKVFEGRVDIASKPNQQVTTALPVGQLVKGLEPGVYVALAVPDGKAIEEDTERATQWFSVSTSG